MRARLASYWLVPILACLHGIWFLGTGPVDDDYICYRYAAQLVSGNGLVFNAGEYVEGFTTPLWVLLHAAWQWLGGGSESLAVGLGVAAWVACVLAACRFAASQKRFPAEALVIAAAPAMGWHAVAGLGTTPLALCLLMAYLRWPYSRMQAGLWLAVACGLRQECALFLVPLFLFCWKEGGLRSTWKPFAAPVSILLGWSAFRWVYYGRFLPMTYDTKKLPWAADLDYGLQYFVDAAANLGWPLLLLLAVIAAQRSRRIAEPAFALGVFLHTFYVIWVGGDFMVLSRFFVPAFPLLVVLAWVALRSQPRLAMALALVGSLGMQWNQVGEHQESRSTRLLLQQGFKQRWARLGTHFKEFAPPETRVAISPIGAFGWASNLPILDILGLTNTSTQGVQPDLERIKVKGHHRANFDWVLDQKPEYVILGNGVRDVAGQFTICPWESGFFQSLRDGGRFPRAYRQATMDVGDGMPLDLFVRRDLALPPETSWVGP